MCGMEIENILIEGDFEKSLSVIKKTYESQRDTIVELRKKLREYNKDEEIVKRDQKIRYLYDHSLQQLTDVEVQRATEFRKKHYEKCCGNGKYKGRGSTWIYTLTGTGIGMCIEIKCPVCGESEDITDTDSW